MLKVPAHVAPHRAARSRFGISSRLATQYVLWTILFSAVLTIGITTFEVINGIRHAKNATSAQHDALFESYSDAIANDLWQYDIADLRVTVDGLVSIGDVDGVSLVAGTVELHAGTLEVGEDVLETTAPLLGPPDQPTREIGQLTLRREVRPIYVAQAKTALGRLAINLAKSSLIVGFSLVAFRLLVSNHLENIASVLRRNDPVSDRGGDIELERVRFGYTGSDELDEIVGAVHSMNADLAASAKTSRELQRELVDLERARAARETGAIVAHDVSNALTPPLGFCQLLQATGSLNEEESRRVSQIETCLLDISIIVNRLRDASSNSQIACHDLAEICDDVVRLASFRRDDTGKDIALESTGPPTYMNCSASDIRELLLNLTYNAIDAIPETGSVTLGCLEVDDQIELSVSDDGAGMSDAVLAECMNPHFTTKGDGGTGLGLSSTAKLADFYGGTMNIDSTLGEGTRVTLRFPARTNIESGVAAADGSAA